jgi:hypothetical protein
VFIDMKNEVYQGFYQFQNEAFIFSKIKISFIKAVQLRYYFLAGSKLLVKFKPKAAFVAVVEAWPAE